MKALLAVAALMLGAAAADPGVTLDGPPMQGGLLHGTAPAGTLSLTLDGRPVPLAGDGRFLIGFDRDAGPEARLVIRRAGDEQVQTLRVAPRAWRIEHVGMARPSGGPTPAFQRLREGELARIEAARTAASDSIGWTQHFIWPARGRLSGQFGSQRIYAGGVPAMWPTRSRTAMPSTPGMTRSSRTRAICSRSWASRIWRACSPEPHVFVSKPKRLIVSSRIRRWAGSSSTIRTRLDMGTQLYIY